MELLRRIWFWLTWQRAHIDTFTMKQAGREARIALLYVLGYFFTSVLIGLIIRSWPMPLFNTKSFIFDFWYAVVFKIGLLLVLPFCWFYYQGYRFRQLLPGWHVSPKSVLIIIASYVAGLSINLLQGRFDLVIDGLSKYTHASALLRVGLGVILPFFIAALPEEFVFRGFLQTRLEKVSGRLIAILVTAILFTAWHLPTRYYLAQGVEGHAGDFMSVLTGTGIPVFCVALFFGLLWDRYRNILTLIAAHWGMDTIPAVVSLLGIKY